MDEPAPILTKGTRPFEAMVPCKPWTSQFLSVDDVTARQSRCGYNAIRHRDGTLRKDRPRPPPGAVPMPSPRAASERWSRPDHVMYWDTGSCFTVETTQKAGYSPRDGLTHDLSVPTRNGLSPRYAKSSIKDIVFSDKTNYAVRDFYGAQHAVPDGAGAPAGPLAQFSSDPSARQIAALEAAVAHEKRMADYARARYVSGMRESLILPEQQTTQHHPAGAVVARPT